MRAQEPAQRHRRDRLEVLDRLGLRADQPHVQTLRPVPDADQQVVGVAAAALPQPGAHRDAPQRGRVGVVPLRRGALLLGDRADPAAHLLEVALVVAPVAVELAALLAGRAAHAAHRHAGHRQRHHPAGDVGDRRPAAAGDEQRGRPGAGEHRQVDERLAEVAAADGLGEFGRRLEGDLAARRGRRLAARAAGGRSSYSRASPAFRPATVRSRPPAPTICAEKIVSPSMPKRGRTGPADPRRLPGSFVSTNVVANTCRITVISTDLRADLAVPDADPGGGVARDPDRQPGPRGRRRGRGAGRLGAAARVRAAAGPDADARREPDPRRRRAAPAHAEHAAARDRLRRRARRGRDRRPHPHGALGGPPHRCRDGAVRVARLWAPRCSPRCSPGRAGRRPPSRPARPRCCS